MGEQELAPGDRAGYREYARSECLQMVGRAGRPQFDTEGVAVIMTQQSTVGQYQVGTWGTHHVQHCLLRGECLCLQQGLLGAAG